MPGKRCAVAVCKNSHIKTKNSRNPIVSYHSFPKAVDLQSTTIRNSWIQGCQRSDNFNPDSSSICSVHFNDNDFEKDLQNKLLGVTSRRILKKTAVPTKHLAIYFDVQKEKMSRQEIPSRRKNEIVKNNMPSVKLIKRKVHPSTSTDIAMSESAQDNERDVSMTYESYEIPENDTFIEVTKELMFHYSSLLQEHEKFKRKSRRQIRALKLRLQYYKNKSAPCKKIHLQATSAKKVKS